MRFDILTLFPEMFEPVLNSSMLGRARTGGILDFNLINIRDFANNKHNSVDDAPYGGGRGMIMQPGPIYRAYMSIAEEIAQKPHVIYLSPKGVKFSQKMAIELSKKDHIVLICGHYEGIDQRIIDEIVDEEISIGDYVLTGGEIPAMAVIDSVSRMIEGVLPGEDCYTDESHFNGLLEYPQYTRPPVFNGRAVPEVLLSGNHAMIQKWRQQMAIEETIKKRPDMIKNNDNEKK